jgi:serine/threonine protein kinase
MELDLFLNKYRFVRELGNGAYGNVSLYVDTTSGEKVAIKVIYERSGGEPNYTSFVREVSGLSLLAQKESPTTAELIEFVNFNTIVMKYYSTNLRHAVLTAESYVKTYYAMQILAGLHENFKFGILHRDLKPDNILVDGVRAYIGDYGICRYTFAPGNSITGNMFTVWWRPPEIISGSTTYDYAADMWSYGIILLEMFTGPLIFQRLGIGLDSKVSEETNNLNMMNAIHQLLITSGPIVEGEESLRGYLKSGKLTPPQYKLLVQLLRYEPSTRALPYELIKEEYFKDYANVIEFTPARQELVKSLGGITNASLAKYSTSIYNSMISLDRLWRRNPTHQLLSRRSAILSDLASTFPSLVDSLSVDHSVITHGLYLFDIWLMKVPLPTISLGRQALVGALFLSSTVIRVKPKKGFEDMSMDYITNGMGRVLEIITTGYTAVPRRMMIYCIHDVYPELATNAKATVPYTYRLKEAMIYGLNILYYIDTLINAILKVESSAVVTGFNQHLEEMKVAYGNNTSVLPWI